MQCALKACKTSFSRANMCQRVIRSTSLVIIEISRPRNHEGAIHYATKEHSTKII